LLFRVSAFSGTGFALLPHRERIVFSQIHENMIMNEKMLIVDSDPTFRENVIQFFSEHDISVCAYNRTDEALPALFSGNFSSAVIEFCDPASRTLLAPLFSHDTAAASVVLTCSQHSMALERAARSLSPAFYFVKPFDINDLYAVVLRIIERNNRQKIIAIRRMNQREGVVNE
jgi:DNA-binding NtrC family response regulator